MQLRSGWAVGGAWEESEENIGTHTLATILFFLIINTHLQQSTWPSSLPGHHSKYKKKLQKVWRKNCNAVAGKLITSPTFIDFRMRKLNFCSTMNSTSEEIFTNTCIQNVKRLPLTAIVITSASNASSKKDAKKTFYFVQSQNQGERLLCTSLLKRFFSFILLRMAIIFNQRSLKDTRIKSYCLINAFSWFF